MTDIVLILLGLLFISQFVAFTKLLHLFKQLNNMLFEVRIYFKSSGIFYEFRNDSIIRSNICQYCKHRMSYINTTGDTESSDFYYKCRRLNIDILLSDSCELFKRDFNIK